MNNIFKFRDYNPITDKINHFTFDSYDKTVHNLFNNITQFIGAKDINKIDMYVGDIVKWDSGVQSVEGLSDDIVQKANQSLQKWISDGRIGNYDYKANGWKQIYRAGVIVSYNGNIAVHNEISTDNHKKNSKYNGTTYYGNIQLSKDYEIIGNSYRDAHLLNDKIFV